MPAGGDLDLLVAAAREAGALALTYFGQDPRSWPKGATSIVSEADFAVDRLLAERLLAARPDYGWLSEETADNPDRLARWRVFVVDPIDGTRAFLAGGGNGAYRSRSSRRRGRSRPCSSRPRSAGSFGRAQAMGPT